MANKMKKKRLYAGYQPISSPDSKAIELNGLVVKHGAHAYKYESLNYDRCENAIYRKAVKHSFVQSEGIRNYNHMRWIITFLIGLLTGLLAFFIDMVTEGIFEWKFGILSRGFASCSGGLCLVPIVMLFLVINCALVLVAAVCVWIEPVAATSGIPEVKTYLNGIKVAHILRLKTLACKAVGVVFSVAGGLPCGKEGPMIHCGSVIAAGISQGKSTSLPFIDFHFNMFRTDRAKRDFVSSGSAAGVAAAFGAPIGGVMFALEEGSSFWNQSLTWRSFFAAMMATFMLNFLLSGVRSKWGDLSFPGLVSFGRFGIGDCPEDDPDCNVLSWSVLDLFLFLVVGAIGGVLGALFNAINEKITIKRMNTIFRRHPIVRVSEAVLFSALVTVVMFCTAYFLGTCQPIPENHDSAIRTYFCPEGQWNDMATLTYNSGEQVIRTVFHSDGGFSAFSMASFFGIYYILACCGYGLGVPAGIFVPTLLPGACFGRFMAIVLQAGLDKLGIEHQIHTSTYSIIGAAAFLGGVVRMTISLTAILMETTDNVVFGLPLMMTLMVAKWVGDLFNQGIYMLHIELRQIPFLDWEPPAEMKGFYAAQVMVRDMICVEEIERVGDLVHLLKTYKHSAFPVVSAKTVVDSDPNGTETRSSYGILLGIILRPQLTILLKNKAWGVRKGDIVEGPVLEYEDFLNEYPRYPTIDSLYIPLEAHKYSVDLTPYMNPCPFTVQQISSLPRVFNLFRTMGLRHLPVVDRHNHLEGLITRKDLTNLEYRYGTTLELEAPCPDGRTVARHSSMMSVEGAMRSKDYYIAEGDVGSLSSFKGEGYLGHSHVSHVTDDEATEEEIF